MNKLNIVMTTDKNYIVPTMVTISSILSSANRDVLFDVYILCAKNLDQISRKRLKSLEEKDPRVTIKFAEIDDERLNKAVTTAHIPVASYYRLYISQLIQEERCLFIDGDMIVREDLQKIYNTDFEECYVMGVKDLGVQCHFSEYTDYAEYLGIPDMESYVNAGFMIFNLKKIREDNLDKRMIEAIDKGYKFMDQDILNKFCYGKIKIIPLKYDFFTEYYGGISKRNLKGYSAEELNDIEQKIVVYHFTGFFKPWLCTRLKVNQIWWEEAAKILEETLYEDTLKAAKEFEKKSDWNYILDAVKEETGIVIFGCSPIGRKIAEKLLRKSLASFIVFADNDEKKIGSQIGDIPVISAIQAYKQYPDAVYIISSQNGFRQIKEQLNGLGIEDDRILRYIHKDETYYERLDERYVEYEKMLMGM